MLMHEHSPEKKERAAGSAIRAIERQRLSGEADRSVEESAVKSDLFAILDRFSPMIFSGIERAALGGHREFFPATIPGFSERCNALFGTGQRGAFSPELMNQWLYARDLKHLLHADGMAVRW